MSIKREEMYNNYTTIPNSIILDNLISNGAKLLYMYIASKPSNWEVSNQNIMKNLHIVSNNTLAKYFKELITNGYIRRKQKTNENGKFIGGYDYELFANPVVAKNENTKNNEIDKTDKHNKTIYPNKTDSNNIKKINKKEEIQTFTENPQLKSAKKVAEYLSNKIKSFKPNYKTPNLVNWEKDILLAFEIDGRTEQELINCIDYIYSDKGQFWRSVVLSGKKLREKFDQIEIQALSNQNQNKSINNASMIDSVYQAEKMGVM